MKRLYLIIVYIVLISFPLESKDNNLLWSTYIGGNKYDDIHCAVVLSNGDIVTGLITRSNDLVTSNNAFQKNLKGNLDLYLAKFNTNGKFIWSTYIGSSSDEYILDITSDKNDNIWIAGETIGIDFPVTNNAYQKNFNGGTGDCIIMKFDKNGNLIYSTYLGGSAYDAFTSIAVDSMNNIWAVGRTWSNDFPTTSNAIQKNKNGTYDAVIVKFSNDGQCLFSSYFGGSDDDFASDVTAFNDKIAITGYSNSKTFPTTKIQPFQNQLNGGYDAFISIFDYNYNLEWSSLFGGQNNDYGLRCRFDNQGNIIFSGVTNSPDLQTKQGVFQENLNGGLDVFVVKFDKNYNWSWTTYYGGSLDEGYDRMYWEPFNMIIDKDNSIIINGVSRSQDLFITSDAYQNVFKGSTDGYYFRIDSSAKMIYSSYLGGSNDEESSYSAIDFAGNLYVFGFTNSKDFPITNDAYQKNENGDWDGYITKFGNTESDVIVDKVSDTCETSIKYKFNPKASIRAINIIKSDNCSLKLDTLSDCIQLSIQLINDNLDGYYKLDICDFNGNIKEIEDSIAGFTIRLAPVDSTHIINFDTTLAGNISCIDVTLYNYGTFTKTFPNIVIKNNIMFSIPQNQFPMIINPGETKLIKICFSPNEYNKALKDTLELQLNCLIKYFILKGISAEEIVYSLSKCNVPIKITYKKYLKDKNYIDFNYDNTNKILKVNLDYDSPVNVKIKIFDYLGNQIDCIYANYPTNFSKVIEKSFLNFQIGAYFLITEINQDVYYNYIYLY